MKRVFLALILAGCAARESERSMQAALPRAGFYVEKYGRIISPRTSNYLNYIGQRLSKSLSKGAGREQTFEIILLNTRLPIAFYAGGHFILVSKGMALAARNEAEFAFIIAHEMAHRHLGHDPENSEKIDEGNEIDADRLAAATLAAAGYDPRLAVTALRNAYSYAGEKILRDESYPPLESRVSKIQEFIADSGWRPPGTVSRREFKDFRDSLL